MGAEDRSWLDPDGPSLLLPTCAPCVHWLLAALQALFYLARQIASQSSEASRIRKGDSLDADKPYKFQREIKARKKTKQGNIVASAMNGGFRLNPRGSLQGGAICTRVSEAAMWIWSECWRRPGDETAEFMGRKEATVAAALGVTGRAVGMVSYHWEDVAQIWRPWLGFWMDFHISRSMAYRKPIRELIYVRDHCACWLEIRLKGAGQKKWGDWEKRLLLKDSRWWLGPGW